MEIKNTKETLLVENVNIAGAKFDDVNMESAVFNNIKLAGARFTDINFSNASIDHANLTGMTINGLLVTDLLAAYKASHPG